MATLRDRIIQALAQYADPQAFQSFMAQGNPGFAPRPPAGLNLNAEELAALQQAGLAPVPTVDPAAMREQARQRAEAHVQSLPPGPVRDRMLARLQQLSNPPPNLPGAFPGAAPPDREALLAQRRQQVESLPPGPVRDRMLAQLQMISNLPQNLPHAFSGAAPLDREALLARMRQQAQSLPPGPAREQMLANIQRAYGLALQAHVPGSAPVPPPYRAPGVPGTGAAALRRAYGRPGTNPGLRPPAVPRVRPAGVQAHPRAAVPTARGKLPLPKLPPLSGAFKPVAVGTPERSRQNPYAATAAGPAVRKLKPAAP